MPKERKARNQFQEIRLRDFRCFHEEQTARLAPLTLLVGDNSTGKTSFLAAVRAVWDVAFRRTEPDFRAAPYDLGAFPEIVHNRSDAKNRASSFGIGFRGQGRLRNAIEFDVTFTSRAAAPSPSRLSWRTNAIQVTYSGIKADTATIDVVSDHGTWRLEVDVEWPFKQWWPPTHFLAQWARGTPDIFDEYSYRLKKLKGTLKAPRREDKANLSNLLHNFAISRREPPFASAPIRSSPRRTYDPTKPSPDPEGAYMPTYFASVHFQDKDRWIELKDRLEHFGRRSGLFDEITVKQLGEMEGGPFQLQIRKAGKHGTSPRQNLIDVGYGVSQALPVLVELFRSQASQMLLFQQPEVHLHPSAQAALGTLFSETASAGRQLVIETHSDYIVDRVLLDVRDRRTDLKAEDVSILYFEREDSDVCIHSIRVADDGSIIDAPEGYRSFFKDELNRVINY